MQLKKNPVRFITYLALLVALEIVLNRFLSINTAGWKIGFAFVPIVVAGALFGPVPAAIVNGLADFLGAMLFPIGPYHPGFTICAACTGAVFGWFLYSKKEEGVSFLPNVVLPVIINNVLFGLLINTCWVAMLYGSKTYIGWFLYRLPEYAIAIPVQLILIPVLLKLCKELRKIIFKKIVL